MKLLVLTALALSSVAHAQIDYSLCNDTINRTFQKEKNYPNGFIQITPTGEIEVAACGTDKRPSRCKMKSFTRLDFQEEYKVTQEPISGPYKPIDKIFRISREPDGKISKIISGEDELQIEYTDKKCVATSLIADIPKENVREMNFDIIACKTFHEIDKKYGKKMSDCFSKDVSSITQADSKSIKRIGVGCTSELKDTYKHLVSLKSDLIGRYADDKTLKRKPFVDIVPPSVFNDQIIENFICSFEASFFPTSGKKECSSHVFELTAPSETALGVILGNKKTCSLIYSDATLDNEEIFKPKSFDSLVYSLVKPVSAGKRSGGGSKAKGNAE